MLLAPYKRFRINTKLSQEQCGQRLAAVVQAQKIVPIVSIPDSSDSRLIFKGRVKPKSFCLRFIDRTRPQASRNSFVVISGQWRDAIGGTEIVVRATFDPLYAVWLGFLSLSLGLFGLFTTLMVLTNPNSSQAEKLYLGIGGALIFVWYVGVYYALHTYFFAKAIIKPCEALREVFEGAS